MISVRSYRTEDRDAVMSLWKTIWPNLAPHNDPLADIERKTDHSPDLLLVAETEAGLKGTVIAGFDGHRGYINRLAVPSEDRRSGIGQALMLEAERRLLSQGCHKINLQIRGTEPELVAFYESLGFKVEDRISLGKLIGD